MRQSLLRLGGHAKPPKVPDWRVYKWEGAPEQVDVQRRLSVYGLRSHWLRNDTWAHHPSFDNSSKQLWKWVFTGFWPGLGLALLTVGYVKYRVEYIDRYEYSYVDEKTWPEDKGRRFDPFSHALLLKSKHDEHH